MITNVKKGSDVLQPSRSDLWGPNSFWMTKRFFFMFQRAVVDWTRIEVDVFCGIDVVFDIGGRPKYVSTRRHIISNNINTIKRAAL